MTEAIIVDAIRTARGKRKGALAALHPVDLLARTLAGALDRANVKPQDVDDVIMGCVTQVGEQGMNIARGAVLAAGLPVEIPGATVNRFCGSGLQAVNFGAQAIASGAAQAGGGRRGRAHDARADGLRRRRAARGPPLPGCSRSGPTSSRRASPQR